MRARRGVAVAALAVAAGGVGLVCAATGADGERDVVERYANAWAAGDYAGMHAQLTDAARRRFGVVDFARRHRAALATATAAKLTIGEPRGGDGVWRIPATASTRVFGEVRDAVELPLLGEGDEARIAWSPHDAFPGLRPGEKLVRDTRLPERADLLARDGSVLAGGETRTSELGPVALAVTGTLGPIPEERKARMHELGVPEDAQVGVSGLERIFEERLAGRPGGELLAGRRTLARRAPRKAPAVRTTIAPKVQEAAVTALGARLGGVVALKPRTGEILAFAGIAFSGLQPPGSTMKVITLAGALEAGVVETSDSFPVQTAASLSGVELQNANGEACGGTLAQSFAHSCNSVFAPMGAKLGAEALVDVAERFGFNRPLPVAGAATSAIPPAGEIGDDLAVGSTAIGQGRVQATTLQMTLVSAAIGLRGRMPEPTLDGRRIGERAKTERAIEADTARKVERMMIGVTREGTGTSAAIPGVKVAGKTGTAELKTTQGCKPGPDGAGGEDLCPPEQQADTTDTSAWFIAHAPAGDGTPKVAVGVLLVQGGAGGDTAAPAAKQVMLAALRRQGRSP